MNSIYQQEYKKMYDDLVYLYEITPIIQNLRENKIKPSRGRKVVESKVHKK